MKSQQISQLMIAFKKAKENLDSARSKICTELNISVENNDANILDIAKRKFSDAHLTESDELAPKITARNVKRRG